MNYLPLFLVYNPPYETLSDKLSLCGSMLLRGMGTVFLVLVVLWGIIELFSYVSTSSEKAAKRKEEIKSSAAANKAQKEEDVKKTVETVQPEAASEPVSDDGAVVAAIMAAIEAYRREEGTYSLPYRVVSFKRKNTKNSRG